VLHGGDFIHRAVALDYNPPDLFPIPRKEMQEYTSVAKGQFSIAQFTRFEQLEQSSLR
jgi:hypothetical protein